MNSTGIMCKSIKKFEMWAYDRMTDGQSNETSYFAATEQRNRGS